MSSRISRYLPWALVAVVLLVRWQNWIVFPHILGLDGYGHCSYLDFVLDTGRWPVPFDSWQTYHPPGYYQVSAWLAGILGWTEIPERYGAAKLVSALPGFVSLFAVDRMSKRLLPEYRVWPVLFMAVLPIAVFISAMVYNVAAALALTTCYLALIVYFWDSPPTLLSECSLGLTLGLAVLVRVDSASLGLLILLRALHLFLKPAQEKPGPLPWRGDVLSGLALSLAVLGLVTSWFFLKNLALHNKFLVTNLDSNLYPYPPTSQFVLPGFFSPRFLVDTGGGIWQNPVAPEGASSLTASLYCSFWTDHTAGWLSKAGLTRWRLVAGILPTICCLIGLYSVAWKASWRPVLSVFLVNLISGFWVVTKIDNYTGYKALYFYSSFPVWALLSGAGIYYLDKRSLKLGSAMKVALLFCYSFLTYSLIWSGV